MGDSAYTDSVPFHSESVYEYETQVLRNTPYQEMFSLTLFQGEKGIDTARDDFGASFLL